MLNFALFSLLFLQFKLYFQCLQLKFLVVELSLDLSNFVLYFDILLFLHDILHFFLV